MEEIVMKSITRKNVVKNPAVKYYNHFSKIVTITIFQYHVLHFLSGCRDRYPRGLTGTCKRKHQCAKLASKSKCSKKLSGVISSKCKRKISSKDRKKHVKQFCRLSCRTKCPSKLLQKS